ncbi:MAG: hypothetical protein WCI61_10955, partial [Chloroflexota bacterium]
MIHRARLRLTAWYAGIFVAMLLVLGAAAYLTMRRTLLGEIDRGVQTVVDGIRSTELELDDHTSETRREYHGETADVFLLLVRADGRVASNPSRVDAESFLSADLVRTALTGRTAWMTVEEDHEHFRLYAAPIMRRGAVVGVALGGRSLSANERDLNALLVTLIAAGAAGTAMAVGGGYVLAGRALQPIEVAY